MAQASARELLAEAIREKRTTLTEVKSKELIKEAGISVVETRLARSSKEALSLAEEMGYPVVLKVVSPEISHKSDIGGVKVNLQDQTQVARAYDEIVSAAKAQPSNRIHGVSVQPMVRQGIEVIMGMSKDPRFGSVLTFGLGGVTVEIYRDVAFRLAPLTRRDAREMVREIKGLPLLQGYRGQKPADIPALEEALLNLSRFVEEHPEIRELDLNPIFAQEKGAVAADARVVLEDEAL